MSGQLAQALRRFQLPATATRAELKAAYLKRAKEVHPDVAGKAGEERFRALQEQFEFAENLLRKGPHASAATSSGAYSNSGFNGQTSGRYSWQSQGASHAYQEPFYHQAGGSYSSHQSSSAAAMNPLTPAQRIRNAVLVTGGVVGVAWLFSTMRSGSSNSSAFSRNVAATSPQGAGGKGVVSPDSVSQPMSAPSREVSDYYKKRSVKSSVKVRNRDAYISPAESVKSRADEDGLGSSLSVIANLARGIRPSEGLGELQDPPQAKTQPSSAPSPASRPVTPPAAPSRDERKIEGDG
eukprot:TRINITY_DN63511_c0_g1_i1.p1 TRINITY_DN63511_c0_g1~~TRINITY_DN63511_c0_g1_i1.p1  ORF type:complete len:295 (+),score=36.81 TRINITY_DN63511_c0_g1_i1:87-971(+)